MPTYGLEELTRWIPCDSFLCSLFYVIDVHNYPVANISHSSYTKVFPPAMLVYRYKESFFGANDHTNYIQHAEIEFLRKKSKFADILLKLDKKEFVLEYPELYVNKCDHIWSLVKFPFSFTSTSIRNANLTATVTNIGEVYMYLYNTIVIYSSWCRVEET